MNDAKKRAEKTEAKSNPLFVRPPFAEEVFDEETKKKFNDLAAWQRHLIVRIIQHGDLPRAATESGVAAYVTKQVDQRLAEQKSMNEAMADGGISPADLTFHLKECLEANCMRFDKHGNAIQFVNLELKLRAIDLACRLRGDFLLKPSDKDPQAGVMELFSDTEDNANKPKP